MVSEKRFRFLNQGLGWVLGLSLSMFFGGCGSDSGMPMGGGSFPPEPCPQDDFICGLDRGVVIINGVMEFPFESTGGETILGDPPHRVIIKSTFFDLSGRRVVRTLTLLIPEDTFGQDINLDHTGSTLTEDHVTENDEVIETLFLLENVSGTVNFRSFSSDPFSFGVNWGYLNAIFTDNDTLETREFRGALLVTHRSDIIID